MGSGSRVPLRFSEDMKLRGFPQGMTGAGLFPGAIVALKGRNGGGSSFVVNEILGVREAYTPLLYAYTHPTSSYRDYHFLQNRLATNRSRWLLHVDLTRPTQIWIISISKLS